MKKSGLEKNILKFHEIPPNLSGQFSFFGQIFCSGQQQLWRPSWNYNIIFSRPLFIIILSQKLCQISVRILCVLPGTKNLHWRIVESVHSLCSDGGRKKRFLFWIYCPLSIRAMAFQCYKPGSINFVYCPYCFWIW